MKKENIIKVVVIAIVVAVTGGILGFKFTQRAQSPTEKVSNVQPAPVAQKQENNVMEVKNGLLQNKVSNIDNKIALNLPVNWGDLVNPKLGKYGSVLNSAYGTNDDQPLLLGIPLDKGFEIIYKEDGSIEGQSIKMISDYKYGKRSEYNEVPSVAVSNYPEKFVNDDSNDPDVRGAMTAQEKERNFQPILDIFKKGNLDGINLTQKCFASKDAGECVMQNYYYRGFWWGNGGSLDDKIGVRYFQNSTGNLRGVGYFEVSGQEIPDTVTGYKVVLINPDKKMIVYIYLPLEGAYSFNRGDFTINGLAEKQVQKAYNYLDNPENYKDQKLGQFLRETEAMVSSIKLVTQ